MTDRANGVSYTVFLVSAQNSTILAHPAKSANKLILNRLGARGLSHQKAG
ncbi:MAG TPA: hypothetical protein VFW90_04310 [Candidatus Saccharimonadales bacterium]|nr:hypothetical protein [Candidatus Saccharimonadales bacterium]